MSLNICSYSLEVYGNDLKMLSERLRSNWMQKLSNHDEPDDSLTSLAWLYDMHPIGLDLETPNRITEMPSNSIANYPKYLVNENQPFAGSLLDPQVRMDYRTKWTGKPPFSYATLICLAMRELGKPKVTLSDIYGWIMSNFAYYRHTDSSWQNSVRHNLSLNKCFEKVPRDKGERGKGGFWRVNPRHADWLEANLAKCRRAAPPPGPPPPVPRSMLLQQQQQHQQQQGMFHSNSLLTQGSTTAPSSITFTQCPTPCTTAYISEISWESSKLNRVPALSPSSASSHSSVSSSPLSFPSVGSPVAFPNKVNQAANGHSISPSISTIFRNQPTLSELADTSVSHFSLPAVHTGPHVSQNYHHPNQILATHRRKSPLFHHQDSDTQCSTLGSDDDLNFANEEEDRMPRSEKQHVLKKTVPNHLPRLSSRLGRSNESPKNSKPNSTNHAWYKESPNVVVGSNHANSKPKLNSRLGNSDQSARKPEQTGLGNLTLTGCGKVRRTKLKSVKRTASDCSDSSRLMPTRILPPRRRYSRWAIPKSGQDNQDKDESENNHQLQTPNSDRKRTDHHLDELGNPKGKHESNPPSRTPRFPLSPFLSTFESDDDDDGDDDDADYVWPPIGRDMNHQINPNVKDKSKLADSFAKSDFSNHRTDNQPTLLNLKTVNNESTVSGVLSLSNHSRSDWDSQQSRAAHHSISPNHLIENPNLQNEPTNNNKSQTNPQFTPVCLGSANLLCQSDKSTGFKWDTTVFLSDDSQNRLDQLFEPDRSGTAALDLFATMNDDDTAPNDFESNRLLDFSVCSESDLELSRPNSSVPSKLSSTGPDESLRISKPINNHHSNNSYQTTMSDSASPLIDDLDLEATDLNFDSFDGLVESTGPIPLDIDFSLTASFTGSYSTSTSDIIMDSQDLGSTIWSSNSCSSDKQLNPGPYFIKSDDPNCSGSMDLLGLQRNQSTDHMWFNDSQSLIASSHSLTMFLNEASVHLFDDISVSDLSTTLNESTDLNRLTTPPSN